MLTTKNPVDKTVLLFLLPAIFFTGCMPPGPRALLDGKKLIEQGKYPEAVEELKVAVLLLNTNAQAWNYLGLACHYAGRLSNAEPAYLKALALDRDLVTAHFNLGCLRLEQNQSDAARTEFITFTTLRGDSAAGWLKLGTAQLRAREFVAAEKSFNDALRISPKNAEAMNGFGIVQLQRNRPREAAQCFSNVLKQQPDYAPALLNLAIVSHFYLNNRPAALQMYRDYLALPSRAPNWESVNSTASLLEQEINAANRPPAAVAPLQPVSNTNPAKPVSNAVSHTTGAAKPEPPTNAVRMATAPPVADVEAVRLPPEPLVKPAQAIVSANEVTGVRTESAGVSPSTGARVEPAKTEKHGFFHSINPFNMFRHDTQSASNKASRAGSSLTNAETAAQVAKRFVRYSYRNPARPGPGDHSAAEKVFAEAVAAQEAEHFTEAMQAYRQAAQLDPAYYEAYYNLGLAASSAGNLPQALVAYELALAVRPESLDARYNFALVLKQANYVVDSAIELEKILAAYPNESRAHLTLGNLYAQQLRQPAQARKHYLKVLETDPHNPQAAAIRYWLTSNQP